MKLLCKSLLVVLCLVGVLSDSASAAGVLGERHAYVQGGVVKPGDDLVDDLVGTSARVELGLNIPLKDGVDFFCNAGHAEMEGEYQIIEAEASRTDYQVGLVCYMGAEEEVNPYIHVAIGAVSFEEDITIAGMMTSADTDDFAWEIGVGVEIDLCESAGITPGIEYENIDGEDDFLGTLDLNVWLNDAIFVAIGGFYAFDAEDIAAYGRLGFCF